MKIESAQFIKGVHSLYFVDLPGYGMVNWYFLVSNYEQKKKELLKEIL